MTKLEYIRESHRQTNRKAWLALDGVYFRLKKKNVLLAYLWKPFVWISYGIVWFISRLAFVVTLLSDIKYSIHFMECDIAEQGLDYTDARKYLEKSKRNTNGGYLMVTIPKNNEIHMELYLHRAA